MKLQDYVELRKNAAVPSSDSIDVLLGQGIPTLEIVQVSQLQYIMRSTEEITTFIVHSRCHFCGSDQHWTYLFVLFSPFRIIDITLIIISLQIACWALVYISFYDGWKAKAKAEVNALVNKHTTNSSNEPLHQRLASIHVSAWEEEMPVLDLIIRETLRINMNRLSLRRNVLEDLTLSGVLIKPGDFVAYSLADVHLNPEIYSLPNEFDPSRFAPGREEDKKGMFSYLGWGAGAFPFL